jgi:amidase
MRPTFEFRSITTNRFMLFCAGAFFCLTGCTPQEPATKSEATLQTGTETFTPIATITETANIPQLQQKMASGELTARQLTAFYLAQIEAKNGALNAIIAVNPDALKIADQLDEERKQGKIRGPLHGIPIAIKDNIETISMPTTAGSLALKDNFTRRDAPVVAKLKAAGAIILAKTNLSEWANMRSERSSSGWSAVGGQTRNPHDLNRSPCGSSSGSGAAVAANLAVAAIGTETDGSITCPASATGIVGIKPTIGLVSRTGIVPISHTQDTAGPMAKSVIDAAMILQVIQGSDPADPTTLLSSTIFESALLPDQALLADQTQSAKNPALSLQGKRIGILTTRVLDHEGVVQVFDAAKQTLSRHGAVLVEDLKASPYDGFGNDSYQVLLYEFKANLNTYLAGLAEPHNQLTLAKIIAFNQKHQAEEMAYFQQEIFIKSQAKGELSDAEYLTAFNKISTATRQHGIDKLLAEHQLDALVTATLGPAWAIDQINGDHVNGLFSSYPAIAGYPHISLPMGKVHDLPVGLSITGAAFSEKELLVLALAFEHANRQSDATQ